MSVAPACPGSQPVRFPVMRVQHAGRSHRQNWALGPPCAARCYRHHRLGNDPGDHRPGRLPRLGAATFADRSLLIEGGGAGPTGSAARCTDQQEQVALVRTGGSALGPTDGSEAHRRKCRDAGARGPARRGTGCGGGRKRTVRPSAMETAAGRQALLEPSFQRNRHQRISTGPKESGGSTSVRTASS